MCSQAQVNLGVDSLDIDSNDPFVQYEIASADHKISYRLNKNLISHRLDSAYGLEGKVVYLYKDDRDISLFWDLETGSYSPSSYSVYTYKNGLIVNQSFNIWDGDLNNLNEDNPSVLRTFIYNEEDQIIEYRGQNLFDIQTGQYTTTIYTYDIKGLLAEVSGYIWSSTTDTLTKVQSINYKHNKDLLLEEIVNRRYLEQFGWYNEDSTYIVYNDKNQIDTTFYFSQGFIKEDYELVFTRHYHYNEDGTLNNIQRYNTFGDNPTQTRYGYWSYGSLGRENTYYIDNQNEYWGKSKLEYEHDSTVLSKNVMYLRTRFSGSFFDGAHDHENHMITWSYEFINGDPVEPQKMIARSEYFYTELIPSSSEDIEPIEATLTVFPNPTSDAFRILGDDITGPLSVRLTNIKGQQVLDKRVYQGEDIDVSLLQSGVYFYTIQKGDKQHVGKIVVER